MKVGIVTIMDYTNYGNRLQNYALWYVLTHRFGCKAVSLAAYEEKPFYNGDYVLWLKDRVAKGLCVFPAFAERRFGPNVTRWANFRSWSRLIPTRNFWQHRSLPASLNEEYDLFLAGSDQIWNHRFSSHKFQDYFLRFAEDKKKAAISGSFGVEFIPDEWRETYREGLSGFSHLSVREDAGQSIIRDLLGIEVPVLIDPVMMLTAEQWRKVSRKPRVDRAKPYVLKYYLGDEAEEERIDHWAKEHGYTVYELLNDQIPELYSAGPGEFLSLIQNAALVCSDSFHCIVFSILFSRPFLAYARRGSGDYMTSRLVTLLGKFGLEDRWKHSVRPEDYLNCDFSQVDRKLEQERSRFTAYMQDVLRGDGNA